MAETRRSERAAELHNRLAPATPMELLDRALARSLYQEATDHDR